MTIPFDVVTAGDYDVRVDAVTGPDQGEYAFYLDALPLATWQGYGVETKLVRGEPQRRTLAAGRHTLVAQCIGRHPGSRGYDARLDALIAVP